LCFPPRGAGERFGDLPIVLVSPIGVAARVRLLAQTPAARELAGRRNQGSDNGSQGGQNAYAPPPRWIRHQISPGGRKGSAAPFTRLHKRAVWSDRMESRRRRSVHRGNKRRPNPDRRNLIPGVIEISRRDASGARSGRAQRRVNPTATL
jgi:hypothetical protein